MDKNGVPVYWRGLSAWLELLIARDGIVIAHRDEGWLAAIRGTHI